MREYLTTQYLFFNVDRIHAQIKTIMLDIITELEDNTRRDKLFEELECTIKDYEDNALRCITSSE